MKSIMLKFSMLCIALTLSLSSFAIEKVDPAKKAEKENLQKEITKFLMNPTGDLKALSNQKGKVYFFINSSNELIVIDVISNSKELKSFVESRLEDRKITTKGIKHKKIYVLPVHFDLKET